MEIEQLIAKISAEKARAEKEVSDTEGLLRLQEVAAQYEGEYKLVWSDDLLQKIQDTPRKTIHSTTIPELDDVIGGFREQQLVSVTAHTKHGKTTFGMFLCHAMEELSPVLIPLEQSNEELVEQWYENGYTLPHFLSPSRLAPTVDVDWIEQRIIEGIAKYNSRFVVIDHLGYIDTFGPDSKFRRENLAFRVGEVMRALKNIAKRWKVVIIVLVHIHQLDEGKPPELEDIKNSSDIKQESDLVMMLWRKNSKQKKIRVYENKTLLSVKANRRTGRNGNVGLSFNTTTGLFESDNDWVKAMEDIAVQEAAHDDEAF